MPPRPTPEQFAAAYEANLLEPAVDAVSGRDGRTSLKEAGRIDDLDAPLSLASPAVGAYFRATGYKSSSKSRVQDGSSAANLAAMQAATGPDGKIQPNRLPMHLRAAFAALGGQAAQAPAGNKARYSPRVMQRILQKYGLEDEQALYTEALKHDDGNRYLKTSELEAAAKVLSGEVKALGIVSDLDKTIIPPHRDALPAEPYPGIVQLLVELEAVDGKQGDLTFVTARSPDRIVDVPDWLREHGVPEGPIETGVSPLPWLAEAEKIRDITKVFDASPGKSFVLFGDSSHRDPEAYKGVMERFPGRVSAAFIHKVTRQVSPDRVEGLTLIDNYAEAAAHLHDLEVLDTDAARRVMVSAQVQGLDITDAEIDGLLGLR